MGKKRACRRADTHPSRGRGGTEACAKKKVGDWAGAVGGGGWRRPGPARRLRLNRPLREKEDDGGSTFPPPLPTVGESFLWCPQQSPPPRIPDLRRGPGEKGDRGSGKSPRAIGGFFSLRPSLVCRSGTGRAYFIRDKAGIFRTAAVASAAAASAAAIPCLRKMRRKPLSRLHLSECKYTVVCTRHNCTGGRCSAINATYCAVRRFAAAKKKVIS